jgi:hypothetical protein
MTGSGNVTDTPKPSYFLGNTLFNQDLTFFETSFEKL